MTCSKQPGLRKHLITQTPKQRGEVSFLQHFKSRNMTRKIPLIHHGHEHLTFYKCFSIIFQLPCWIPSPPLQTRLSRVAIPLLRLRRHRSVRRGGRGLRRSRLRRRVHLSLADLQASGFAVLCHALMAALAISWVNKALWHSVVCSRYIYIYVYVYVYVYIYVIIIYIYMLLQYIYIYMLWCIYNMYIYKMYILHQCLG